MEDAIKNTAPNVNDPSAKTVKFFFCFEAGSMTKKDSVFSVFPHSFKFQKSRKFLNIAKILPITTEA